MIYAIKIMGMYCMFIVFRKVRSPRQKRVLVVLEICLFFCVQTQLLLNELIWGGGGGLYKVHRTAVKITAVCN
jgi:hypothetical protein